MSDILPKFKAYFFLCVISFLINLSIIVAKFSFSVMDLCGLTIGSFIPFVNLTILIGTNYPLEVLAFITMILLIMSGIEVFLLLMFIFQTASNILWHPDV